VLKEAQPPSGLTKRLVAYATAGNKTESGTGSAAASAPEHTTPSAKSKSKSRIAAAQAAKAKSALPVLKTNSKSPPRRSDDGLRGPQAGVAIVQDVQELVPSTDHVVKTDNDDDGGATTSTTVAVQSDVGVVDAASESASSQHWRHPALATQSFVFAESERSGGFDACQCSV